MYHLPIEKKYIISEESGWLQTNDSQELLIVFVSITENLSIFHKDLKLNIIQITIFCLFAEIGGINVEWRSSFLWWNKLGSQLNGINIFHLKYVRSEACAHLVFQVNMVELCSVRHKLSVWSNVK
jgi:hypothetical protein